VPERRLDAPALSEEELEELDHLGERGRALLNRMREADRNKTDFLSMLAHELKSPMATILGFAQMLHAHWDAVATNKRSEMLSIMEDETSRLARLVDDLLDLSRIDTGTLTFDFQPVDIRRVVESVLKMHPSLKARHKIMSEYPPELPSVRADFDRLRQVFLNLITNATRYSTPSTLIVVRGEARNGLVHLLVCDEGIGIAPEHHEVVFERFASVSKPAWVKKGTGLGLYISKGIVEGHGGRLWVESERGRGATFHFTLPVAGARA
jgi:signal transduction histidine kinase